MTEITQPIPISTRYRRRVYEPPELATPRTDPAEPTSAPLLTERAMRSLEAVDGATMAEMRALRDETERFMMLYRFGMDEVITKLSILRDEFAHTHDYNPFEHLSSRLKSLDSVIAKIGRRGIEPTFDSIREHITDIAGVRVTCSFVSDAYRIFELLTGQPDVRVIAIKDYIKNPKPNGYKSLHAIIGVPVFLSTGPVSVTIEVQIRTIAMDFWASLEHKIYYKYDGQVPADLLAGLTSAAHTASELDQRMEQLHREVHGVSASEAPAQSA